MSWIEAIILGIVQGLTEFLPISSSGHIELGKVLLDVDMAENLTFSILVHFATVLSTIVIFWPEIIRLLKGLAAGKWNEETKYVFLIFISILPVMLVYLFLNSWVESMFEGKVVLVGCMLLVTALLLLSTNMASAGEGKMTPLKALVTGIAQAVAVLPGISRSGATITTALLLGVDKEKATRFSFLMVLPPVVGATILEIRKIAVEDTLATQSIAWLPMLLGFLAAFVAGLLACQWMINIVKNGKISYFAIYCIIIGLIAIASQWM